MKLIARSGYHTKNTPEDTYDSLLLAIHTDYIDGVEVNLRMTKDNVIVVYQTDAIYNHPMHTISSLTYSELQNYNLGSKVSHHSILTLEDTLNLFKSASKMLILNLNDQGENNSNYVQAILKLVNDYPNDNIYIKSPCKEIVLEVRGNIQKARLGAVIMDLEPYFWNLNLDFYSISVQKTKVTECSKYIQKQLETNHFVMFGDVSDSSIYEDVKNSLGEEIVENSYIITSNVVNLAKNYYQN